MIARPFQNITLWQIGEEICYTIKLRYGQKWNVKLENNIYTLTRENVTIKLKKDDLKKYFKLWEK